MASETYTMERVIADVVADPRLADARERCSVLHALALWDDISPADYAAAGGGICREYALDAYPWTAVAATAE
jgi:hypothetical protein